LLGFSARPADVLEELPEEPFMRHSFIAFFVLPILLSACADVGEGRVGSEEAAIGPDAAKLLFKGLALGYGPRVTISPTLHQNVGLDVLIEDVSLRNRVVAEYDKIVDAIEKREPGYFYRFAAAISSGDHVRIHTALQEAADVTSKVLPNAEQLAASVPCEPITLPSAKPGSEQQTQRCSDGTDDGIAVAVTDVVAIVEFVHTWLAVQSQVAITTAAYVFVAIKVYVGAKTDGADNSLLRERIIDEIAVYYRR
jgi:SdpC family antimicrobial peptide